MRIRNPLFAGLILIGAVLLMMVTFALVILRRLFGRPAAMPRFERRVRPSAARPAPAGQGDVIDIVATEVKD